jgi:RNA polymerase sigma factor (sigma-70 family)
MNKTTRMERQLLFVSPQRLDGYEAARGLWHESDEEKAITRQRYLEREQLLAWLHAVMLLELTARQRQIIRLHYLESKSFREIGAELGMHPSTAHRHCSKGVQKLKAMAKRTGLGRR